MTTNANGIAAAPTFTANSTTGGPYNVTATASGGSSPQASFSLINITVPTVTTPTSASIASTTATLGGNVTANGGASLTKVGVLYAPTATNNNPTLGGSGVTEVDAASAVTGVFTINASGLSIATGYSFVAFATNSVGTTYTTPVSTFTTMSPFNVNGSTLTVEGTIGNDTFSISASALLLSVTLNGTTNNYSTSTISTVIFNGNGGSDSSTILGLQGTATASFSPTLTTVTGSNYSYQINGSHTVYVYGAVGDTATMNGPAGADSFSGLPAYSVMANAAGNATPTTTRRLASAPSMPFPRPAPTLPACTTRPATTRSPPTRPAAR